MLNLIIKHGIKLTSIGNINVKFEEVFNSHLKQ